MLLDTCILLDVVRSVHREIPRAASAAVRLRESLDQQECRLAVSEVVRREWNDNVPQVQEETIRHFSKMDEAAKIFHDICEDINVELKFERPLYTECTLDQSLRQLSEDLLDLAFTIDIDTESNNRATRRIMTKTPPAGRGSEIKDCIILEQYLALGRQLIEVGSETCIVFCSSNTRDFCGADRRPHAEIVADLSQVGIDFATKLDWANHLLFKEV
ncbi:hypothetical protein Pan189_28100 [Stratiformator vulcanicus]|uniref:DUF4935 domain-containing protein n=2 Tax=Stratiformator vulcanicus TaxID=2527980 RepID=A0A517R3I3_9PLAN|nr:hypothetical protein Pan189_28100 [Stratiformator vulcanicus]